MALEHGNLINGLFKKGLLTATGRDRLKEVAAGLVASGQMSASEGKLLTAEVQYTPENLAAIREAQVQRLIDLKFHKLLGVTKDEYRASIPKILPQPEGYKGRFDIPLVVDPRIALNAQHTVAEVAERIDTYNLRDIVDVPNGPYTIWAHDAQRNRYLTVRQIRSQLAADEILSTQYEVTALYIQHPELFENYGVDAPGSQFDFYRAPCLYIFDGKPLVDARWVGDVCPRWGSLSRGNEINVGA